MLDMGFEPQIKEVMNRVSSERQTAMFTATWPKECEKLAEKYIKYPVKVQIGSDSITANQDITQLIEVCESESDKQSSLRKVLGLLSDEGSCLVFCNTKRKCRDLAWEISKESSDLGAVELHGDLNQSQRDSAMEKFKAGTARVLVATDVAARGLDLRNITIVVNYDAPNNAEDYVHRIGRTGRAGDKGEAYTFLMSSGDEKKARDIQSIMEKAGQDVPENLSDLARGRYTGSSSAGKSSWGSSWSKDDSWKKDDSWWKKDDSWNKNEWKSDGASGGSWKRSADEAALESEDEPNSKTARGDEAEEPKPAKQRMVELKELLLEGLITDEEYDEARKEILASLKAGGQP
eukprot:TRINITY_DN3754_c1_g1_i1.p1 TRINITY_DN3754_c1_g1~~TRINITY_DN3754_c1_g1_i1.p1  ORF type:complete len:348 (+),score=98.01 TRINITY_DN3754_c1_g1_i1:2-1045(+)